MKINSPEHKEEWEKKFDKDYGSSEDAWTLGIIASAIGHGQKSRFSSASHITAKLRKLVLQTRQEAKREVLYRLIVVADLGEYEDLRREVVKLSSDLGITL